MEISAGEDAVLQFLWIPDTTYHELAEQEAPYAFTSLQIVPQPQEGLASFLRSTDKPSAVLSDSDVGVRYSVFLDGWDVTLNYLYHYQDFPVLYQSLYLEPRLPEVSVEPEYERNHLYGGTLSNVFDNFTLRTEIAYSSSTYHVSSDLLRQGVVDSDELASVIGLDWQFGAQNTILSGQWFQSYLFAYDNSIIRDEVEHNMSLFYQRTFDNETWQFDALALHSLNNNDSMFQLKLRYLMLSNLVVWLGGDFFRGDDDGMFGQFSNQDRVIFGVQLGF